MKEVKTSEKIKQNLDKIEMLLRGTDQEVKDEINMFLWNINKDLEYSIKKILDKRV